MATTITLANGTRIVVGKIPFIRSVSFGIFVKNGSRNEPHGLSGISHFIEHMLFKGTATRSAKDIADELDAVGGQLNAYTTKEYTCYYTKTLDVHFDVALSVLSDMYFNSVFEDSDIKKEANVIAEEINMYEDSPEDLVHDAIQGKVWKNNPLGLPILGTEESVASFDSQIMKKYFAENYTPANTVISIAGNVNDEMIDKIKEMFSNASGNGEERAYTVPVFTPGYLEIEKDIEQLHMLLSFDSFGVGSDETYSMAVLNTFLGGGMSSRLFQNIREDKGLVYSIYSYNSSYNDVGIFGIYAALSQENAGDVLNYIIEEINGLKRNPFTDEIINRSKEQIKSNHLMGLESSSNRMSSAGRAVLLLNRTLSTEELIAKVDAVTKESISALVDKVFFGKKPGLCAVGNLSKELESAYLKSWGA